MYLRELRLNWQHLISAGVGMGVGTALSLYVTSLFAPALIAEFGWSKAEFALLGSLSLLYLPLFPFVGRFTDRYGPRRAAAIGFVGLCAGYLGFAMLNGSLISFFLLYFFQHMAGAFTTGIVFTRIVVQNFDSSRGIALSLAMTCPPLIGAIAAPALGYVIDTEGWRTGYVAMAGITAVGGAVSLLVMGGGNAGSAPRHAASPKLSREELTELLRHPMLLLIIAGIFLVNVPAVIATSQLKLAVMSEGILSADASLLASLYAIGVIAGRFVCGLALDRLPTHVVAAIALGVPVIGYIVMASNMSAFALVALGVALIGLAQGAEADLGAFLISRKFPIRNYSLLLSLVVTMVAAGTAAGSLLLSFTLSYSDSYAPFMWISALATLLGALLFMMTGRFPRAANPVATDPAVDAA